MVIKFEGQVGEEVVSFKRSGVLEARSLGGQGFRRLGVSRGQEWARRRSGGIQELIMISGGQGVARSRPGVQENLLGWKEKRELP